MPTIENLQFKIQATLNDARAQPKESRNTIKTLELMLELAEVVRNHDLGLMGL